MLAAPPPRPTSTTTQHTPHPGGGGGGGRFFLPSPRSSRPSHLLRHHPHPPMPRRPCLATFPAPSPAPAGLTAARRPSTSKASPAGGQQRPCRPAPTPPPPTTTPAGPHRRRPASRTCAGTRGDSGSPCWWPRRTPRRTCWCCTRLRSTPSCRRACWDSRGRPTQLRLRPSLLRRHLRPPVRWQGACGAACTGAEGSTRLPPAVPPLPLPWGRVYPTPRPLHPALYPALLLRRSTPLVPQPVRSFLGGQWPGPYLPGARPSATSAGAGLRCMAMTHALPRRCCSRPLIPCHPPPHSLA